MYIITMTKRRSHEFEKDRGEVHERFWRGRKEGENSVIIISKNKSL